MKQISIILLLFIFFASNTSAQETIGEVKYDHYSYQDAIKQYKRALKKDKNNGQVLFRLANAYRLNGKTADAEQWFAKAVVFYPEPDCKLFYAQTLLSNKKYLKAKQWFDSYSKVAESERDVQLSKEMMVFCQDLNDGNVLEQMYNVQEVNFNGEDFDYSPTFYSDSALVFVSNREVETTKKFKRTKIDNWTGQRYMKLFLATHTGDSKFSEPTKFFTETDAYFHEGPAVFNNKKDIVYYTKNVNERKSKQVDENHNTRLGIFQSSSQDGKWTEPEPLSITNAEYSIQHPALSKDESFMIFCSDMPGGFGGTDLYISRYEGNTWGVAENLGSKINTAGNEAFPFLDEQDNLYFSSNLLIGFGGLDIFKSMNDDGEWSQPENFGAPINSSKDDFGFAITSDWSRGYFTSSRKGDDNIYTFEASYGMIVQNNKLTEKKKNGKGSNGVRKNGKTSEDKIYVCGTVINEKYKTLLKDANIKVVSLCEGEEIEYVTLEDGAFGFEAPRNCDYVMVATKNNFEEEIAKLSTTGKDANPCLEVVIELKFKESTIADLLNGDGKGGNGKGGNGTQIIDGMVIELKNIYFDLDKYFIRQDASQDLENLYALLIKYPNMRGELGAHTDSRAPHAYNIKLSHNRAKSAVKYLTNKGIAKNRLTWKGYGETQLKNNCPDGVECSEKQHQRNRRIEFKVTYFDGVIYSTEKQNYVE